MKLSQTPSPWVLVTAQTTSETEMCHFMVLHLTHQHSRLLQNRMALIEPDDEKPELYCHCYWYSPYGWYVFADEGIRGYLEDPHNNEEGEGTLSWSFFQWDTPDEKLSLLAATESIRASYIRLFAEGRAQITGSGAHSKAEYYSMEFPLSEILQQYDQHCQ